MSVCWHAGFCLSKGRARFLRILVISLAGLLALSWYWNRSPVSRRSTKSPTQIRRHDEGCLSYGCPIYPSEMKNVQTDQPHNGNATIAVTMTRKSNRRDPPVNQDAAVVISPFRTSSSLLNTTTDDFFVGVFDGHGDTGHIVAQYAVRAVPERLSEKLKQNSTTNHENEKAWVIQALKETFVEVDAEAPPKSAMRGGCTATVALRRGPHLFIANTGDSRTIVVESVRRNVNEIMYMSRRDKPHLEEERERITRLGGKIHIPRDNPELSRVIVYSDQAQEHIGLAMSRSIGDWEWVGVTAEPLVEVLDIQSLSNAFVVSASDGLWDARRPNFVAKHFADSFYQNGKSPIDTCKDMIQRASPGNEEQYRDDITIAAIKIV